MSRIASAFAARRKALIAYLTVGYPSVEATLEVIPALVSAGCDIIELGIPFSDPLADGATIQEASFKALQQGVTPELCLKVAGQLRQRVEAPLVFMTYYNPVLHHGLDSFCVACEQMGVDGLIVPDLPPDEAGELEAASQGHGLDLIYLLAPNSSKQRIALVGQRSRGFVYLVSLTGVTGARAKLPPELEGFVARVRKVAKQPLCVGFGVSTPEQARRVAQVADGVIVGSRIIQLLRDENPPYDATRAFVRSLREALDT